MTAPVGQEPVLHIIGDVTVSEHWIITPRGTVPLAGSAWTVQPATSSVERTPGWAIAAAIVFFFACFLGLLFLLVKRTEITGWCDVHIEQPATGFQHMTRVPVHKGTQVFDLEDDVQAVRHLAQMAGLGRGF